MSYGFATHLWISGAPTPAAVAGWLRKVLPDVTAADVVAARLGEKTILLAVNTSEREARWRSIRLVGAAAKEVTGFDWTLIDMQPDQGFWRVETRSGGILELDPERTDPAKPEAVEQAKTVLKNLVPLELRELHHYVDWGQELEEIGNGGRPPSLPGVVVEWLSLGLPAAPTPSTAVRAVRKNPLALILVALCIVSSAFTVSMVQPRGPAAFRPRFLHFAIEGVAFWLMTFAFARQGASHEPRWRFFAKGAVAILAAGGVWALLPV